MRRLLSVLVVALLSAAAIAQGAGPVRVERAFESGGKVDMQLGGGDYTVRAGASDKIVVICRARTEEDTNSIKADVSVVGRFAKIHTSGPHHEFTVVIEVPAETNLHIRLMAGDMSIHGITGNKDIASHAGDLNIDVVDPQDYRKVDASVLAGDLNAGPFRVNKSGLFRSFSQTGQGRYLLHAHLGAGDLNLH